MKKLLDNQTKILSVLLIVGIFLFWIKSEPFLKLPYDPWFHLSFIRRIFIENSQVNYLMWPGDTIPYQSNWHFIWASIFRILNIDNTFIWASIIHKVQSALVFLSVFVFSFVSIKKLTNRDNYFVILLSITSSIIWFIGTGTFSIEFQQSWIVWYSLTAQSIGISFFWFGSAMIIELFWGKNSKKIKILLSIGILVSSIIILLIHELELVYLLGYLVFAVIVNIKKLYKMLGNLLIFITIGLAATIFLVWNYVSARYGNLNLFENVMDLFNNGVIHVEDRNQSVLSEIILISLIVTILLVIGLFLKRYKEGVFRSISLATNQSLFWFLILCTFFFLLIPVTPYLSVIVGEMLDPSVVWRLRYAMPWFIFIPLCSHYLLSSVAQDLNIESIKNVSLSMSMIMIGLFISYNWNHVLKDNLASLKNSYNNALGVQYSSEELQFLENELEGDSETVYILRGDLGYLAVSLYGKYVLQSRFEVLPASTSTSYKVENNEIIFNRQKYPLKEIDFEDSIVLDIDLEMFKGSIYRP